MAYKSKSILNIIKEIESSKVYLPAIQRKFVWGKPQIELLFDSLMRNFPIGTFLFWNLESKVANGYVFYEFLKEYDQRNPYNLKKEGSFLNPEIVGVLDGQQRLSSMYIGLQGTHTEKARYYHWGNEKAYRKTRLFLNLLSLPYYLDSKGNILVEEDKNFEFRFLTEEDYRNWTSRTLKIVNEEGIESVKEEPMYWFKVGDILTFPDDLDLDKIIGELLTNCKTEKQKAAIETNKRFVRKAIEILHNRIAKEALINYFEVNKTDLEDILKIFTRVNSGGTILNKTDLLFSTIVATWDDGREEIEGLLKLINGKGEKFNFTNEYLMRTCLMLIDGPITYKVNSFESENVERIKTEWPNIKNAVSSTVDLLVEFGFNSSLLTSQNATMLIAYYIMKGGDLSEMSKKGLQKYLIHALLNGIYGSSQDQLIAVLRNALREEKVTDAGKKEYILKNKNFSFDELLKVTLPLKKSLSVSEPQIDLYLNYKKGSASFFVLSLLYPNLKYNEVSFHQDHIHPVAMFTKERFIEMGLPEETWNEWIGLKDTIPNLQLMEGKQNVSKNATEFKKWVGQLPRDKFENFCLSNFIPQEQDFDFSNFISFFEARKEKLKLELKKVLAFSTTVNLVTAEEEPPFNEEEESVEQPMEAE